MDMGRGEESKKRAEAWSRFRDGTACVRSRRLYMASL